MSDHRKRNCRVKALIGHGYERTQYSVFVGLQDPTKI
ncbi:MAG: hypothetical protein ACFB2Y_13080 [Fulvivirga sp.]